MINTKLKEILDIAEANNHILSSVDMLSDGLVYIRGLKNDSSEYFTLEEYIGKFVKKEAEEEAIEEDIDPFEICLDAGHGPETAGKRSPYIPQAYRILHEHEVNQHVLKLLHVMLLEDGRFKVGVSSAESSDVSLQDRVKFERKQNYDMFLSLHTDAIGDNWQTKVKGVLSLHSEGSVLGREYSGMVQQNIIESMKYKQEYNRGYRSDQSLLNSRLYVLKNTKAPAVLVEMEFHDNPDVIDNLLDPNWRYRMAQSLYKGICDCAGFKYKLSVGGE